MNSRTYRAAAVDGCRVGRRRQCSIVAVRSTQSAPRVLLISLSFHGQRRRWLGSHSALTENPNITLSQHIEHSLQPTHARCTSVSVLFSFLLLFASDGWGFGWCCCCGPNESMESVRSSLQCTDHLHSHADQVSRSITFGLASGVRVANTSNTIRSAWRRFVWKKLYSISPLILKLSPSDTISAVCARWPTSCTYVVCSVFTRMCFCKQQLSLIKRTKNRMRHATIVFHAVSCLLINALFMKWKKLKSNRSIWTEASVQSWRCEFDRWWNISAACTRCTTTRSLLPDLTFRCQMDRHKYNISDCRVKMEVTTHEENGQPDNGSQHGDDLSTISNSIVLVTLRSNNAKDQSTKATDNSKFAAFDQ